MTPTQTQTLTAQCLELSSMNARLVMNEAKLASYEQAVSLARAIATMAAREIEFYAHLVGTDVEIDLQPMSFFISLCTVYGAKAFGNKLDMVEYVQRFSASFVMQALTDGFDNWFFEQAQEMAREEYHVLVHGDYA